MKRGIILICIILLVSIPLILAQDAPTAPGSIGQEDAEQIKNATDKIPLDPNTGKLDQNKLDEQKSKAEKRIEAINEYVGPITHFLFGVELKLSWIFIWSILLWILLAEIYIEPSKAIFSIRNWIAVPIGLILSTLSMHGFGKNFINIIENISKTWIASLSITLAFLFITAIYVIIMRIVNKKIKENRLRASEEEINENAKWAKTHTEVIKEELNSYKNNK